MVNRYVTIDGFKYAVVSGSYIRRWQRAFTSQLAASIIRLNFVDRGPGLRIYTMTLQLNTWDLDTEVYQDGVTQTLDQQRANLEAAYNKISTPIEFLDPFGDPPLIPGTDTPGGVYMTNLNEILPIYSTVQKPYVTMEVELTEATQVVA